MVEFENKSIYEKNKNSSEFNGPRYDLTSTDANLLTKELLDENLLHLPESGRFVTIEVNGDSKYSNIGRYTELAAFGPGDYLADNPDLCAEEYKPYESSSNFFLLIDREATRPVGVLRAIGNSKSGIKTLNDAQKEPFNVDIEDVVRIHGISDFDKVWDIGTIAVLPEYRGVDAGLPSISLYRAIYLSSIEKGIEHWVSIIDNKLLRALKGVFAMPFVPLANSEPGPYLGFEKSHAVYARVSEFREELERRMREVKSQMSKKILESLVYDDNDKNIVLNGTN